MRWTAAFILFAATFLASLAPAQSTSISTNSALRFDTHHYVDVADPAAVLSGFSDFTIELWFFFYDHSTIANVSDPATGATAWYLSIFSSQDENNFSGQNELRFRFVPNNQPFFSYLTAYSLPWEDSQWHHWAVTRAGSTLTMYLDGNVCATATEGAPMRNLGAAQHLEIGGNQGAYPCNSSCENFQGLLNELRIWNVARSAFDLATTMHCAIAGTEPGLVGYWPMDEGTGQVAYDYSPSANHGELGSFPIADPEDPTWVSTSTSLFRGVRDPLKPYGQANSPAARLVIEDSSTSDFPGPWIAQIGLSIDFLNAYSPSGGPLNFVWSGPPNASVVLVAGSLNVGAAVIPGLGSIDIGTPPTFGDVVILMDGVGTTMGQPEQLNAAGNLTQSFAVTVPPGTAFDFQGFVVQPIGSSVFGVLPTAAVRARFN